MAISWVVGIKLPGLEYNNQKVEAAFRKELVLGEDDKVKFCSIPTITELFVGIKFNYNRLFLHYGYFDLWAYGFDQFMVIVPYLIAGPALFASAITLGIVVQISNAFQKVQGSLSLFIYNWTTITELRSIWKRLHEFQDNLDKYAPTKPVKSLRKEVVMPTLTAIKQRSEVILDMLKKLRIQEVIAIALISIVVVFIEVRKFFTTWKKE